MTIPDVAVDYEDRGAGAAHSVLVELGQLLGAYRDALVIIGGAVPALLLPGRGHVGTLDIDLDLNPEKLANEGYAGLIETLEAAGYQRGGALKPFQLSRTVMLSDGGAPIAVIVDLLMPKGARTARHTPPLVKGLRVQEADGGDVALRHHLSLEISGVMPDGRRNSVEMLVASIPALLVMKGYALTKRDKKKDAYDIYFCVKHCSDGLDALAEACRPLLDDPSARAGLALIATKFRAVDDFGPMTVRMFLEGTPTADGMTPDQVQQDAFQQVRALMRALGLDQSQ